MYIGFHLKYRYSYPILMKLEFSRQISEKFFFFFIIIIIIIFFFFINRRYNPWWVLACFTISFHNLLSLHFSLQFLTFIFFKSSSTCSSHLSLGLPTGLDEHGSHSVNFLTVLIVSTHYIYIFQVTSHSVTLHMYNELLPSSMHIFRLLFFFHVV